MQALSWIGNTRAGVDAFPASWNSAHYAAMPGAAAMVTRLRASIALVVTLGFVRCAEQNISPVAPSTQAAAFPAALLPGVDALSVDVGSTSGGTPIRFTGTNLQRGASVTFGRVTVTSNSWDPRDPPGTSLLITAPPHIEGAVNLTVTNPNGASAALNQRFQYVPPQSFDFNGSWDGASYDGQHTMIQFTIMNNVLISASCQGLENMTVSLKAAVRDGEFLSDGPDGGSVSGRIVSASEATGTLRVAACGADTIWRASKLAP
jgi:IPT/TIG domain